MVRGFGRQAGGGVDVARAWVVEGLRERSRGRALGALAMGQGEREPLPLHAGKQLRVAVEIQAVRYTMVGLGRVTAMSQSLPRASTVPSEKRALALPWLPASTLICGPASWRPLRVMTLTTPKNALAPYTAEPGPGTNSTRSTRSRSSWKSVPMAAWS